MKRLRSRSQSQSQSQSTSENEYASAHSEENYGSQQDINPKKKVRIMNSPEQNLFNQTPDLPDLVNDNVVANEFNENDRAEGFNEDEYLTEEEGSIPKQFNIN